MSRSASAPTEQRHSKELAPPSGPEGDAALSLVQIGYLPPMRYDVDHDASDAVNNPPERLGSQNMYPNDGQISVKALPIEGDSFDNGSIPPEDQWYNLLLGGSVGGQELGVEGSESLSLFMLVLADLY